MLGLVLVALLTPPAASQPRVTPGTTDACYGSADSFWVESLFDALEDRAGLVCACRASAGPARVALHFVIDAPGRVRETTATSATSLTADETACVVDRVRRVARAWLTSTSRHIQPPPGGSHAAYSSSFDHESFACPPPPADTGSAFSSAFMRRHPSGVRVGAPRPAPQCMRPIAAQLDLSYAW